MANCANSAMYHHEDTPPLSSKRPLPIARSRPTSAGGRRLDSTGHGTGKGRLYKRWHLDGWMDGWIYSTLTPFFQLIMDQFLTHKNYSFVVIPGTTVASSRAASQAMIGEG